MTKFIFVALLSFFLHPHFLHSQKITQFGNEILSKSDCIVQATPVFQSYTLGGGTVVVWKIEAMHYGNIKKGGSITVCYPKKRIFQQESQVLFLQAMASPSTFSCVGEFVFHGQEIKLKAIQDLLALESMKDGQDKMNAYMEYCLERLSQSDPWLVEHAFAEWQYFLATQGKAFPPQLLLTKLKAVYKKMPDSPWRDSIAKNLIQFQSQLSESTAEKKIYSWPEKIKNAQNAILHSGQEKEKLDALQVLSLFPGNVSHQAFISALQDSSPDVRAQAVFYLGFHQNRQAIPFLMKILEQDPCLRVRKNAILALAELQATQAQKKIEFYLQFPYTKSAAEFALKKLQAN